MRLGGTLFLLSIFVFIGVAGGPDIAKFAAPLLLVAGIAAAFGTRSDTKSRIEDVEEVPEYDNVIHFNEFR